MPASDSARTASASTGCGSMPAPNDSKRSLASARTKPSATWRRAELPVQRRTTFAFMLTTATGNGRHHAGLGVVGRGQVSDSLRNRQAGGRRSVAGRAVRESEVVRAAGRGAAGAGQAVGPATPRWWARHVSGAARHAAHDAAARVR